MDRRPTYNELELRVKELEKELQDAKRTEEILQEAENIKQLLRSAPFGVFLIDLSGKILECNEKGAERLGRTTETAIGNVLIDYFPAKVSENRRLKGMEAIQSRQEITFEDQVEGRWYRNSIFPFFDEEDKPVRLAIYRADVTEYKNALDALEKSEEKYRQLSELLPQVVFEIDVNGNILFANHMAFDLFGYSRVDFEKGLNALQMLIPEDRERAVANIQKALKGEKFGGTEYTALTKDGRTYPVMLHSTPVMSEGKPVGLKGIMVDLTEVKQAQEALRESEEKYRNILESMEEGYYEVDLAGNFTFLNDAMYRIWGYTRDELMGMNNREYMDPETAREVYKLYNEVYTTGSPIKGYPWKIVRGERTEGYVEVSASLIKDSQGEAIGFRGIVRDVTEKMQAEEALKASQQRLLQIINFLPDATMVIDLDGKVIAWNRAIEEMTGTRAEDILGKGDYEYAIPFYGKKRPVLIDLVGKWDKEIEKKYQYVKKEGESLVSETYDPKVKPGGFLWNKASLLYDRNGNAIGAIESIRDITDMKVAEEALRESEEKFRSLSENAPDIIYTVAFDGSFTYVNPAWKAILGYEPEEVLGKYFVDFVKQEEARDYVRIFKNVRDKRKTVKDIDVNIIHKNGSTRLFSASGAPNVNRCGEVTGIVGLFKDITDQRKLEKQLRQSQRMEAIGTLSGGIAHDFNNLLMGIQGRTSLMLMDVGPSHPHFEHLKGIEDYVKSAADLTKQLLGFARGGKYEVKPIDINELIKTGSRMFGRTKKEIKIHWKYQKDVWTIEADRGQIEQVLMNLYVNAWQAMPSGGELYLQTENVHLDENYVKPFEIKPGNYVKISVTDTGVGMDEATRHRIFDPFFTTKEMGRGMGLGLASAYGIIKNHGGFINVYSEEGEGTTFNIYLPVSEKEVIEEKELSEDLLKGSETVLFVDDEEMIIEIGEQVLQKLGYELFLARSGKEATEIFAKNKDKIDIVILDMIMPDMSGGDTFDRLREIKPDIKIILSSGYSINGKASEILDKGCDGFIQKPFNMKQLSRKLREILDKK